jgi:hypothetical protein
MCHLPREHRVEVFMSSKSTHVARLQHIVQLFREIEPTMNMNEITAFTIVAQQPGIVIDHIREEMGDISASSVSRIIDRLSDRTSHGMALVTKEETFFEGVRKLPGGHSMNRGGLGHGGGSLGRFDDL